MSALHAWTWRPVFTAAAWYRSSRKTPCRRFRALYSCPVRPVLHCIESETQCQSPSWSPSHSPLRTNGAQWKGCDHVRFGSRMNDTWASRRASLAGRPFFSQP